MKRFLFILFLIGCNIFCFAQGGDSSNATINFYRPWMSFGILGKIDVYINNNLVGKIANNENFSCLAPNTGVIHIKTRGSASLSKKFTEIEMNVEPGKQYFVKIMWDSNPLAWIPKTIITQVPYEEAKEKFPNLKDTQVASNNNQLNQPHLSPDQSIKTSESSTSTIENKSTVIPVTSDVDINIPLSKKTNSHSYAIIIGNEDYSSFQPELNAEVNVSYAINDASTFKEYCNQTLGIPNENIRYIKDATLGRMNQTIGWVNKIIEKEEGNAEVIFYYAGHGLPDEQIHEPYIIPVDISGNDLSSAIKLKDLYTKLTQYPSKRVTVFLDACFSGGARNAGLVAVRGVKVKPKEDALHGNIVVFTSSSGEQSSLPYKEKQHGMFTYFLLKKLQETKGNVNYSDLYNYLKKEVDLNCVKINNKEQTPSLLISTGLEEQWMKWKLLN